jgi:hypothetical protein
MRTTGITLASLLFLLAPQGRVGAPAAAQDGGARQPAEPQRGAQVRIEGDVAIVENGATLSEVLEVLAPAAKRRFLVKREVEPKLQSIRVKLSEALRVPADRAAELLDTVFYPHDMVFLPPTAPDLAWGICDLRGQDRMKLREAVTMIQPNEVAAYAARNQMVGVMIPLNRTNAREIAASLRPMFPDNQVNTVMNVASTNELMVTGVGPDVAKMVEIVLNADKSHVPSNTHDSTGRVDGEAGSTESVIRTMHALQSRVEALEREVEALKKK